MITLPLTGKIVSDSSADARNTEDQIMLDNRQLQECIDEIRDGSEDAVKKLVNEYYTFYENAAKAASLSEKDAKHFANRATRSLFSNIRSISDAKSWQALADQELEGLSQFEPEIPPAPAAEKPKNKIRFEEEEEALEEKPKRAKDRLKHLFDDEEEGETEEIRPARKPKKRQEPVYEEETEEIQRPVKKKRRFEDLLQDEETEEIRKPEKKQKKPKRVKEEEEDYEDDYEDEEEGFHFPIWLLSLFAVILLIGFAVLAVKIFLPDTWESITDKFSKKDHPAETAKPTPETTPEPTMDYTLTPEETAEPNGEEGTEATAEPTQEAPVNAIIGTASVKVDKLNIRTKPSTAGDRVGTAVNGKTYDVYETASGEGYTWYRIADNQWIADKGGQWVTYKAN